MKFLCTQENLIKGLSIVSHIASKNASLPILNNILIQAQGGVIRLSATNLEIGISVVIRGKIEKEGVYTIPGKLFTDYISLLKEETLTIDQDGADIVVRSEKSESRFRGISAEEFPVIPQIQRDAKITCASNDLREGIAQTVFAAAYDDTRPEISGVLFQVDGTTLTMAATDSYRLAERTITLKEGLGTPNTSIVPVRALQELARVLGGEGAVEVFVTENQIVFIYNDCEIVSRLIDGQYPQYEQIIPEAHETEVRVETAVLMKAVRATGLFSRPGMNDILVTIDADAKQLNLHAANTQLGENTQHINVEVSGKSNSIIFNSRYFLDGLANIGSDEVTLQLTNTTDPGVLRPTSNTAYVYIIMPIKQ